MSEDSWYAWLPSAAAGMQLLQVPCLTWVRCRVNWDSELQVLTPFTRGVVLLFGAGITLSVTGLGLVVIVGHGELGGSRLGFALSLFLALFWTARAAAQLTWLAPSWRGRFPSLHVLLSVLYPSIALLYTTFVIVHW